MKRLMVGLLISLLLSACGGSYTVTRTASPAPRQIQAVAIAPVDGNSTEVDSYVNAALIGQGMVIKAPLAVGTRTSLDVDAIISYKDVWGWDLSTYLRGMTIDMYEASSGTLLVTGKWEDSFFHTWFRGEGVSQELVKQMFEKVKLPKGI